MGCCDAKAYHKEVLHVDSRCVVHILRLAHRRLELVQ